MRKAMLALALLAVGVGNVAGGGDPTQSDQDAKREAAIAAFTQKMKDLNYPALFDQAAQEFNVPADVLKGVAFAETRWDQLTWPSGETVSPETGMPRPYGIMSLWDNNYFGHSLLEAAALIGETPDELKQDAFQNMRGGAALLRQIYDQTAKPDGTTEADIESWRYAIRKYCGIPEPDLNAQHALDIYVWMTKGYHEYGIEWNARPVNLEPIREETRRIVAEEQAKRKARLAAANSNALSLATALKPGALAGTERLTPAITNRPLVPVAAAVPAVTQPAAPGLHKLWWFVGVALVVLLAVFAVARKLSRTQP
jgi:hypothetical protein